MRIFTLVIPTLFLLIVLMSSFPTTGSGKGVTDTRTNIKCPVCGMFVSKYSDWQASISFKDGHTAFFDGPKDMFKYLLDIKRYDASRKREDVTAVKVTDYYSVSQIDAQKAWFVSGSDVFGPMGKELIPLKSQEDAEEFMKDHSGKATIRLNEVTLEVIKTLD